MQLKGRLTNHKRKQNAQCVVGLMRQLTPLEVNVPNLLREIIKEGKIRSEGVFIGEFVERMV